MKTNRRRFLSLLGVGTAAGPLAAKAALDEGIAKQAGLNLHQVAGLSGGLPPPSQSADLLPNGSYISYQDKYIKTAEYVKMFGLPQVIDDSYRSNSKYVHALDPDIACKRSWSMSVKFMTQRERNYQRMVEGINYTASHYRRKALIENILGFEWPW